MGKLEIIKLWTPRVAVVLAALLFLAAFWGIVHFGFRFFEIGSYFTPAVQTETPIPGIDEKQSAKLKEFIDQRAQKRNSIDSYQNLGMKDPFNLP